MQARLRQSRLLSCQPLSAMTTRMQYLRCQLPKFQTNSTEPRQGAWLHQHLCSHPPPTTWQGFTWPSVLQHIQPQPHCTPSLMWACEGCWQHANIYVSNPHL